MRSEAELEGEDFAARQNAAADIFLAVEEVDKPVLSEVEAGMAEASAQFRQSGGRFMFRQPIGTILGLALMLGLAATPAAAQDARGASDFSSVESLAGAGALAEKGVLVRVFLFPAEFGGEDIPQNVVYITPQAAAARELVVGTLRRMIEDGRLDRMNVVPAYKGRSFVPVAIAFKAWHTSKEGRFEQTIQIW